MLISLNPMRMYELVTHYAQTENKYVVCIDNQNYFSLSTEKQQLIKEFHTDRIPESEIDEIFGEKFTFYAFNTEEVAVENAFEWFPRLDEVEDSDYWVYAYVVRPDGTIPYENRFLVQSQQNSEEGLTGG